MKNKNILADSWASVIFLLTGLWFSSALANPTGVFQCAMRYLRTVNNPARYDVCIHNVLVNQLVENIGLVFILLALILSIRGFWKNRNKSERITALIILTIFGFTIASMLFLW